ncbi:MAG: hypothetical protein HRT67_06675 [Flavobacteriaceae bacterium]|nr:hypothetical protein [Flavobacteriaceae bacterium]
MKENISVSKALTKGYLIVTIPVFIIMFGTMGILFYFASIKSIPFWFAPLSFIIGPILGWFYWSYSITKWRIWAFENVRNVNELKKKAIEQGFIWKDGSWFNKTEYKTENDKQKWNELKKKFDKKDIYQEDRSIPNQSVIYFSKFKNTYELILMLLCLGGGVFLLLEGNSYILGSLLTIVGIYFSFKELKQVLDNNPQIEINSKGIKTINTEFKNWSLVKNEEVQFEGYGKNRYYYLYFEFEGGIEKLKINDYNISPKKLENLLKTYRIRNNKNYS